MGLHNISTDSMMLEHHCANPHCVYHNCAAWEPFLQCQHHDELTYVAIPAAELRERLAGQLSDEDLAKVEDSYIQQRTTMGRRQGQTRQVPIDHPEIEYSHPGTIALPVCKEVLESGPRAGQPCGSRLFLKVDFTQEELEAANIRIVERDPTNPTIIKSISQHPMVARSLQLHAALQARGVTYKEPPAPPAPVQAEALIATLKAAGIDTSLIEIGAPGAA